MGSRSWWFWCWTGQCPWLQDRGEAPTASRYGKLNESDAGLHRLSLLDGSVRTNLDDKFPMPKNGRPISQPFASGLITSHKQKNCLCTVRLTRASQSVLLIHISDLRLALFWLHSWIDMCLTISFCSFTIVTWDLHSDCTVKLTCALQSVFAHSH